MMVQASPTFYAPATPLVARPSASPTLATYVGNSLSVEGTEVSRQALQHAQQARGQGDSKTAELDTMIALFANPVYFYTQQYESLADAQKADAREAIQLDALA